MVEYGVDQVFGLRAGDQHTSVYEEIQAVEFAPAYQIGDRFARGAARDQLCIALGFSIAERVLVVREEPTALYSEYVGKNHLRVKIGRRVLHHRAAVRLQRPAHVQLWWKALVSIQFAAKQICLCLMGALKRSRDFGLDWCCCFG